MLSNARIEDRLGVDGYTLTIECDADGGAFVNVARDGRHVAFMSWWRKVPTRPWPVDVPQERVEDVLHRCWAKAEAIENEWREHLPPPGPIVAPPEGLT